MAGWDKPLARCTVIIRLSLLWPGRPPVQDTGQGGPLIASAYENDRRANVKSFAGGIALAVFALFGAGFAPDAQAQQITLKFSHYVPPNHGIQKDLIEPFAKALSEKTHGKVKVEIYAVNSQFGNAARQADQVRAGVTDIAFGLRGIPRGRFEKSSIIELPFMVKDAGVGSRVLWELYKDGTLKSDYKGFKVLALMTHHGGLVHTTEKPVRTLEDFKGLRLRTPSDAVSAMLQYLGASPVGLPPAQIYENLQKNVIDGVVTTWDLVAAIKLNELIKYHTDAKLYVAAFYIVMDQKRFDALPKDVQQAIDELTGDTWVNQFGKLWDKWDAVGLADSKKRGHEIIEINDATRAKWKAQLKPMIDKYLDGLKSKGVPNARQIYDKMQAMVAKYEKTN
jgi:TRAP-type C4-dicarboxylate transport system substrate-binding protein